MDNSDVQLENPSFKTAGAGKVNLNTQSLDYHLKTNLLQISPDSKLAKFQEQLGGNFPARVSGPIQKPVL